jgi:hypothetical protein
VSEFEAKVNFSLILFMFFTVLQFKLNQFFNLSEELFDQIQDVEGQITDEKAKDTPDSEFIQELEDRLSELRQELNNSYDYPLTQYRVIFYSKIVSKPYTNLKNLA